MRPDYNGNSKRRLKSYVRVCRVCDEIHNTTSRTSGSLCQACLDKARVRIGNKNACKKAKG